MTKKTSLPASGDIIQHDFREPSKDTPPAKELRIVQWNIERGYELTGIIEELKKLDADVIGLQEIDIGCERYPTPSTPLTEGAASRSGWVDVGVEIAQALKLNYAFVCEFEELYSLERSERDQGGGVHGNAMLSKFSFSTVEAVRHLHHPVNWEAGLHPKCKAEPRRGERFSLCVVLEHPLPLVVYSCHLEVFCGISDRLYQFSDVLRDARSKAKAGYEAQVILGDLNTMADGVVRFLPLFCTDHLRFKTLGIRESTFWQQNLFQVTDTDHSDLTTDDSGHLLNRRLLFWGLDSNYCRHLINPGFYDPWDTEKDVTLQKPKTGCINWNLVSGKLDWVLIRDLRTVEKSIGNHDYRLSDHKWLMVTVKATLSP